MTHDQRQMKALCNIDLEGWDHLTIADWIRRDPEQRWRIRADRYSPVSCVTVLLDRRNHHYSAWVTTGIVHVTADGRTGRASVEAAVRAMAALADSLDAAEALP